MHQFHIERFAPIDINGVDALNRLDVEGDTLRLTVADRGPGGGMRLVADNGLFYEFVPVAELGSSNPTRHWAANIETGVDYAIVLSGGSAFGLDVRTGVVRYLEQQKIGFAVAGFQPIWRTTSTLLP